MNPSSLTSTQLNPKSTLSTMLNHYEVLLTINYSIFHKSNIIQPWFHHHAAINQPPTNDQLITS